MLEASVLSVFHIFSCLSSSCWIAVPILCRVKNNCFDLFCPHWHILSEWELMFWQALQTHNPCLLWVGSVWPESEVVKNLRLLHKEQTSLLWLLLLRHHLQYQIGVEMTSSSQPSTVSFNDFFLYPIKLWSSIAICLHLSLWLRTEFKRHGDCLLNVRLCSWWVSDDGKEACLGAINLSCIDRTAGIAQIRTWVRALIVSCVEQTAKSKAVSTIM